MNRRKFAAVIAVLMAALLMLTACGSNGNNSSSGNSPSSSSSSNSSNSSSSGNNTGRVLVVYFSASGNTERVAREIADEADAYLFEIEPKDAYTSADLDWTDDSSRVMKEHENEKLRDIELKTTKVPNWDQYDTVFIGYPIWWGDAAWPINNFVRKNDFSGKTVIPFCTSASSGIGDSGSKLAKMAGTGDWQDGQRFDERPDDDEVENWVDSIIVDD